jgi:predicted phage tail protein
MGAAQQLDITGAKGGSSKPKTPVESPDTLQSTNIASILLAVGEGEFDGTPTDRDIYLDNTPIMDASGNVNFPGVKWEWRRGTVEQEYIKGIPAIESDTTVNVELRSDAPFTRALSNTKLSRLRLRFSWPRLVKQDSSGNTNGYRIEYAIDVATDGGAYVEANRGAVNGKTTNGYQRSVSVDLPAATSGWMFRVRRITPNQNSGTVADTMTIAGYTEIIDEKLRYPNTALLYIEFDAQQFQNIPSVTVKCRARRWPVPSNYDPDTRTYTGVWDGTFKQAWTNNPAFVTYGLCVEDRFGLGKRIKPWMVDKWEMYRIAQYCDQMVPNGVGGVEPRFLCDMNLQGRAEAWTLLRDLSAIYRGMVYWAHGSLFMQADMPRAQDIDYVFTRSNVIDGDFVYGGAERNTHYSRALVSYDNPANNYDTDVIPVTDNALQRRYRDRPVEISAIGCTRASEAQRRGKWALLSNSQDRTVTFKTGMEGRIPLPGFVIPVADELVAGRPNGGRISATAGRVITLDRDTPIKAGDRLILNLPNGSAQARTVQSVNGRAVTVTTAYSVQPEPQLQWAIDYDDLAIQLFRVLKTTRTQEGEYEITALEFNPSKFAAIDTGAKLEERPISVIPITTVPPPASVTLTSAHAISQGIAVSTMTIDWPAVEGAVAYDVEWRKDNGNWVRLQRIGATSVDVVGIYAGAYLARVRAVSSFDITSIWRESMLTELKGKEGLPPALAYLNTTSEILGIRLNWGFPEGTSDTAYTEIQMASESTGQNPVALGQFAYPTPTYLHSGMAAAVVRYFRGRLVDRTGNIGPWSDWIYGQSSADADAILDYITGKITETHLGQSLLSEIEKISGEGPGSVNERLTAGDIALQNQIDSLQAQLADVVGAPDWDAGQAYLAGSLVKLDGKLYRAKQDVPAGTPVTDAAFWEYIGDYASLGEMVIALAIRLDGVETSVEEIDGQLAAMATRIIGVETQVFPRMAGATEWKAGDSGVRATASSIYSAFSSADMALSRRIDTVEAQIGDDLNARFEQEAYARVTADEALATQITTVSAKVDDTEARLQQEVTARATADEALTVQITNANSKIGDNEAAIITEAQTRANADQAISSSVTQLSSRVGTTEALVQDTSEALVDLEGNVSATRNIKVGVDVNGRYYGAGMGLSVENTPEGMQSMVIFLANLFAVMHQPGGTPKSVFAIQNGQVFMNSAIINQADIINLIITGELKSSNYVAGQQGIRINFVTNEFEINGVRPGQGRMNITHQLLSFYDTTRLRGRLGIWG